MVSEVFSSADGHHEYRLNCGTDVVSGLIAVFIWFYLSEYICVLCLLVFFHSK